MSSASESVRPSGKRTGLSLAGRQRRDGWLLVLPTMILIIGLSVYPLVYSLWLAFHQWDLQTPGHPLIWFDNFSKALGDERMWAALKNTGFIVTVGVAIEFVFGLGLALMLVDSFRIKRLVMPIFMLPVTMVPVVVGLGWRMLWDNQYGAINALIRVFFGTGRQYHLAWAQTTPPSLAMIVTQVWQWTPFMFIILLAALSGVNPELYEAATLDGPGWWHPARHHAAVDQSHRGGGGSVSGARCVQDI